jgi:hypothetical protein
MSSEVFRFSTIRPVQHAPVVVLNNTIELHKISTEFLESLRTERTKSRADMLRVVQQYIATANFFDSVKKIDPRYAAFYNIIYSGKYAHTLSVLKNEFKKIFGSEPGSICNSNEHKNFNALVVNSLVASIISPAIDPARRVFIVNLVYTFEIIKRIGADDANPGRVFDARILLPEGIYPLPAPADASHGELRATMAESQKKAAEARQQKVLEMATTLTGYTEAVSEIITAFESNSLQNGNGNAKSRGLALSPATFERLSVETKTILQQEGIDITTVDVPRTVYLMEKKAAEISRKLHRDAQNGKTMVRLGSYIIPVDRLIAPTLDGESTTMHIGNPGPCPTVSVNSSPNTAVTVPEGHGEARILGIADLLIVEQDLSHYKLGEIAHVENVLKSEVRERELRSTKRREETIVSETEETTVKETELNNSERFDLHTESQQIINEDTSVQAGVTVSASYGPSVDVTANFNYTNTSSQQDSQSASSNFARETTSRAINRLEKRTLERRTVVNFEELVEINKHGFDNKTGTTNISGIYRWLDKYYDAQIVNYGKRLMLEFIVPEPAAFLRLALTNQPVTGITAVKPDVPGYCLPDTKTFVSLKPEDICRHNYMFWAGKYEAKDVTAPPSAMSLSTAGSSVADITKTQSVNGEDIKLSSSYLENLNIAEGYIPQTAYINFFGETQKFDPKETIIQIQDQQIRYVEPFDDKLITLQAVKTDKIPVSINTTGWHNYEILVTVVSTLSTEKYQEWQLATFIAVMTAYNEQKARFDNEVNAARIQADLSGIKGKNPAINRETEKTELKKSCISLLTGQRFDLFNAVTHKAPPLGYPEIDFAEAKAEGPYIQFFEQAFEWNNVTYVFYPYFWSKKEDWLTLAQIDDTDPLFARFLQAGAARVQLPVRLGFEKSILHYLELGEIWNGEGVLVNTTGGEANALHVSVLEELKTQLGNNTFDGKGTINVAKNNVNVTGTDTEFSDDDVDKRIVIAGVTYVIKKVNSPTSIQLRTQYLGNNASDLKYAFGAKLVGDSWEVKLPTNLVKISDNNSDIQL